MQKKAPREAGQGDATSCLDSLARWTLRGKPSPAPRVEGFNSTADRSGSWTLGLQPIRPGECSDDAAVRADHAWAKTRDRNRFPVGVHIEHGFMVTEIADDPQRAHPQRPTTPGVVEVAVNEVLSPKKPAQQVPADTQ